jgi:copper chaperone
MKLELKVPSVVCNGCIDTVTKAIVNLDPNATVTGDLASKTFSVETQASETAIKEAIVQTGHTLA